MQKTADEVTVKQVHIKDRFWSEIQNRIINVVIPFQERVLNDEVEGVAKSPSIVGRICRNVMNFIAQVI